MKVLIVYLITQNLVSRENIVNVMKNQKLLIEDDNNPYKDYNASIRQK